MHILKISFNFVFAVSMPRALFLSTVSKGRLLQINWIMIIRESENKTTIEI